MSSPSPPRAENSGGAEMDNIVDINTGRAMRRLSSLSIVLLDLVKACEDLLEQRPRDPELRKIVQCLDAFSREISGRELQGDEQD
jgi:hypothetical protein